jgi:glycosyltransferase involved in cell wall biosynthesis
MRRRLGDAARKRVEAEFELERCTDRLLQVLQTAYA